MATRFVEIDRDTALLLPPDLRDWVPANHLVHFVIDAVEKLDLRQIKVNTRGTGDAQYPPAMLLGLLTSLFAPWGIATTASVAALALALVLFVVKVAALGTVLAAAEVFWAKVRLFRVPELLAGSFLLALLAVTASYFLSGA